MKEELQKDLGDAKSIEVISKMEGGVLIQNTLKKDLINAIDKLSNSYQTATHSELIALASNIKHSLSLLRVFNNAKVNAKFLEDRLDEILKEEGDTA